jgi:hypothetical protein
MGPGASMLVAQWSIDVHRIFRVDSASATASASASASSAAAGAGANAMHLGAGVPLPQRSVAARDLESVGQSLAP